MITIEGKYTNAKIFTTNNEATAIEQYALDQLQMLCDNETSAGCTIRVMPDVHPGKVGTIGLTMTIGDKVMPNLVGIDIGCGMTIAQIEGRKVEFQKLDKVIQENIPVGFKIRNKVLPRAEKFNLELLKCYKHIREQRAKQSLGTLGGGNHFIEVDKDNDGNLYVVVHSGSRNLGKEVTEYYINRGYNELKEKGIDIPYELTYLEGETLKDYINDLYIVQKFASLNRDIIIDEILKGMKWKYTGYYECIHNYIDGSIRTTVTFGAPMIRKGAISAVFGEPVIIPINMRDGIILGTGLGNKDWNYSAPHGAGRIMKRTDIKNNHTVSEFKSNMKGIYSSCINKDTLDEAPFAYRNIDDIIEVIGETVNVDKILTPIYNYKAGK